MILIKIASFRELRLNTICTRNNWHKFKRKATNPLIIWTKNSLITGNIFFWNLWTKLCTSVLKFDKNVNKHNTIFYKCILFLLLSFSLNNNFMFVPHSSFIYIMIEKRVCLETLTYSLKWHRKNCCLVGSFYLYHCIYLTPKHIIFFVYLRLLQFAEY